jgi:hypothetical protein
MQQTLGSQQQQQVGHIKEVWASTLETEMAAIRDLVEEYPFVSMVRVALHECILFGLIYWG